MIGQWGARIPRQRLLDLCSGSVATRACALRFPLYVVTELTTSQQISKNDEFRRTVKAVYTQT